MNTCEDTQNKTGNVRHKGVFGKPLLQWKAVGITHSECVFGDLGIQHAMRMRHIICGLLRLYDIFVHQLINGKNVGGEGGEIIGLKMCVLIFSTTFV
jgi:hypothetical protein